MRIHHSLAHELQTTNKASQCICSMDKFSAIYISNQVKTVAFSPDGTRNMSQITFYGISAIYGSITTADPIPMHICGLFYKTHCTDALAALRIDYSRFFLQERGEMMFRELYSLCIPSRGHWIHMGSVRERVRRQGNGDTRERKRDTEDMRFRDRIRVYMFERKAKGGGPDTQGKDWYRIWWYAPANQVRPFMMFPEQEKDKREKHTEGIAQQRRKIITGSRRHVTWDLSRATRSRNVKTSHAKRALCDPSHFN